MSFFWKTLTYPYSNGNLEYILPFLTTTTNWGAKPFFPRRSSSAYISIIISSSGNILDLGLLIFLLTMLFVCWCPLILTILHLSHKCVYLLENQIGHLIFLSENTFLVITSAIQYPFHTRMVFFLHRDYCWRSCWQIRCCRNTSNWNSCPCSVYKEMSISCMVFFGI